MYGQVVVGAPGTGKTTYCRGMQMFLRSIGRHAQIVNLDPANEEPKARHDVTEAEADMAEYAVDISELVSLEDVMEELDLGPNGGMIYCLEFLEHNIDWLDEKIMGIKRDNPDSYLLFDLPGQVELSAHHESLRNIMAKIQKKHNLRLTAVHLVDATHCTEASKYIASVFLSLSTMLRLELPHVNVLSKIDLIEKDNSLDFNLDFYTDVMDLDYLLPLLPGTPLYKQGGNNKLVSHEQAVKEALEAAEEDEDEDDDDSSQDNKIDLEPKTFFEEKYQKLNTAICDLIDQYSLVAFQTLNIQDKASVAKLVRHIDKTNGYFEVITAAETDILNQSTEQDMADVMEHYLRH